jgi:hypothetical protein
MTPEQLTTEKKIRASAWKDYLNEKRWCAWFQGDRRPDGDGYAKIPRGSHSNPETWSTFDELCEALKPGDGFGYNFLGGDLHPLDLDHVRNAQTGQICNEAMLLLSRLQSFSEISISGRGLHVLFRGKVRGHQLTETCVQYWNPAKAPRFFTITGDLVGEAFSTIRDLGEDFNLVFATAAHISAKCREELKVVDPEQWAKLPVEPVRKNAEPREKSKTKSRKRHPDFNMEEFLSWAGLPVDNVTDNEIGKCYRVTKCPIKGEPHVGQNSTTTNFGMTVDGGLMFHCQSTGCVENSFVDVLKKLEAEKGKYPSKVYEEVAEKHSDDDRVGYTQKASTIMKEHRRWLWPGYLGLNKVAHFGGKSAEGKSPVTDDLAARVSAGLPWPDGAENVLGPRSVIILAAEDDWADTVLPRLEVAGADLNNIYRFFVTQKTVEITPSLDCDCKRLEEQIQSIGDVSLVIIDPITNYLGSKKMNAEEEIRGGILMPLSLVAKQHDCSIITVGHFNKRGNEAAILQRLMGCAAFVGVARDVFVFGPDPEDLDKHAHVMGELRNKTAPPLKYKTVGVPHEWDGQISETVAIKWCGPAKDLDMDEVVNAPKQQEKSITTKAVMLISGMLRSGSKKKSELDQALKENGIEPEKLVWNRIKKRCKAEARPLPGKGAGWEWFLPTPEQASFDGDISRKEKAA